MSIEIGDKTYGTLSLGTKTPPIPYSKSVPVLHHVKNKYGVKFFNCGEFYQFSEESNNLQMFRNFMDEVDPKEEIIVSIKGCMDLGKMQMDGSKEGVAKSIENCISYFEGAKNRPKILFEPARVDPQVPIEKTVEYIYEYVKAGKIDGIALTEVGAESISKAVKVAPISAIEVEFSLISQHIIEMGILAEASKHNIPVLAYSPLGRGYLTDSTLQTTDFIASLPPTDSRKKMGFDRFTEEIFLKNLPRLKALYEYAQSKNMLLEALAMSYVSSVSGLENFEGIPKVTKVLPLPSGSTVEKVDKNYGSMVQLSRKEVDELQEILAKYPIYGYRYNAHVESLLNG